MSVVNSRQEKIVLPRSGADGFWRMIMEHYAGTDQRRWKYLAMLALRENGGWPLETIGLVFDHPRATSAAALTRSKPNCGTASTPNEWDDDCEE